MANFRNEIVYLDLIKDKNYDQLIHFQSIFILFYFCCCRCFNNDYFYKDRFVNILNSWGLDLSETKSFIPHMTLFKLSKLKGDFKRKGQLLILFLCCCCCCYCKNIKYIFIGIKKIDKNLYEHLNETKFGFELVNKIHLCNIREKQPDGFYKTEIFFKFNSNI